MAKKHKKLSPVEQQIESSLEHQREAERQDIQDVQRKNKGLWKAIEQREFGDARNPPKT